MEIKHHALFGKWRRYKMSSNENAKESPKKKSKVKGCAFILIGFAIIFFIIGKLGNDSKGEQNAATEQVQQQETQEQAQPPEVQKEPEPDNKKYKTVKMPDGKVWFAENLNYAIGNSACYDNKEENCEKCGRLYDWETAMKACPKGYHLPTNEEWKKLEKASSSPPKNAEFAKAEKLLGYSLSAGTNLKSKSGWKVDFEGNSGNGSDKYGFNGIPCGYGMFSHNDHKYTYYDYDSYAIFWSATESECDSGKKTDKCIWKWRLVSNDQSMTSGDQRNYYDERNKSNIYSVRCIKD
jgi:uncharacterized protein (TIGR02145 family)